MGDTEAKQQLLAKFSDYLDTTPTNTSNIEKPEIDLYRLFTELAALKAEVKIESRQVKTAIEEFQGLIALLQNSNEQLNNELEERRQQQDADKEKIERPFLLNLLDLRDRIEAGVEQAKSYQPGWLAFLDESASAHIQSQQQGMDISLRRIDGLLERYKVKPVDAVGKQLDPHTMQVSAIEQRAGFGDGVVLIEPRKGYLREGQLLRVAEVIVNKIDREMK